MLELGRFTQLYLLVSASALADRINDCQAKNSAISDGNFRGNKNIPVKTVVDEALKNCDFIENVIVLNRTGEKVEMIKGRDLWWNEVLEGQSDYNEAEVMSAEDLLFILYTSGSTGKPKGVVHTTAGYMIYTHYSFLNVFSMKLMMFIGAQLI